ncbi:hypothetical protein BDN72DRAFT_773971 [Pluteus cervinus]|uniref:Uncharacterized protein n=1 Tax=Pluteus cervinus TaxID=181527 RepID=A0ACD3AGY3_9AGAR|nr:hypothetical protein BDN72DRAFT_773971 [Pluteus cervinus]
MALNLDEIDNEILLGTSHSDVNLSVRLIKALRNASLEDDIKDEALLYSIWNPKETTPSIDPILRLSIDLYTALNTSSSEQTYATIKEAITRYDKKIKPLSHYAVNKRIEELTGVSEVRIDMCPNSCYAFTGELKDATTCPSCGASRWKGDNKSPAQQFHIIPAGPQIQALYRSPDGARAMQYRHDITTKILKELEATEEEGVDLYEDIYHGIDYINDIKSGKMKEEDVPVLFSIDGAQLYRDKTSNCWFFIWIILGLSPDKRYKKRYVLPGGFIPGPAKPKNVESFMFPALRHLAALQKDGLQVYDYLLRKTKTIYPHLRFGTADTVAIPILTGHVGHGGQLGCRVFCGLIGRRKFKGTVYYPVALRPKNCTQHIEGTMHPDTNLADHVNTQTHEFIRNIQTLLTATDHNDYTTKRKQTGIVKPTLFLGMSPNHTHTLPKCFPPDLMHLFALNVPSLFLELWRGILRADKSKIEDCDHAFLVGDDWKEHGALVASMRPHLPTSFGRTPRDPALKINSGYKAWEFMLYIWSLGPAVFRPYIPEPYYSHFCRLVLAVRTFQQRRIKRKRIIELQAELIRWVYQYEVMYYRQDINRLHLVRPCVHAITHIANSTYHTGPLSLVAQWSLENTIGNLGREIRQHSNPYMNVSQCGVRRAQINALKTLIPDLEPPKTPPMWSKPLLNGFGLHPARESTCLLDGFEGTALESYLEIPPQSEDLWVTKWAALSLPNKQRARSKWREILRDEDDGRIARNVKVLINNTTRFAEVQYFFEYPDSLVSENATQALAMLSLYSLPDPNLLQESAQTLVACKYQGDAALCVIPVEAIQAVVAIPPLPLKATEEGGPYSNYCFVAEKPFLDMMELEDNDEQ